MQDLMGRLAAAFGFSVIALTAVAIVFLVLFGCILAMVGLGLWIIDAVCGTTYLTFQLAVAIAVVLTVLKMMFGTNV